MARGSAATTEKAPAGGVSPGPSPVPGLRYVSDGMAGIRRKRAGRGFTYVDPEGGRLDDPETLARIRALAIPPAWTDVWICPISSGHLQATGRDVRGRKQYRYHDRWRRVRDETKFGRLADFGRALTRIRRRVDRDLRRPGLPRERVLATVVRLLDVAFMRVGNPEYARDNESFGLTTLRNRHVAVRGRSLRFEFRGKGGKLHTLSLEDERLARVVKRCRDLPGYELFQCLEDGVRRTVDSGDVNEYLQEIGGDFTAKDFRTWAGTVLAARELAAQAPPRSKRGATRAVNQAIEAVGHQLGNTPAIAKKSYVHPEVIESFLDGTLHSSWERKMPKPPRGLSGLRANELRLLLLLEDRGRRRSAAG
ncbi:MAG: DNA topoisomerase IB [Actinomycetota bacterium]